VQKRGILVGGVLLFFEKGKELIMMPMLILHLGIAGYGIYMQIALIGSILSIFTTCGMNISILRYYHLNRNELTISLRIIIFSSILAGGFWLLTGRWFIHIFNLPIETLYLSFVIAILISLKVIFFGYYRASEQYNKILYYFTSFEIIEVCALGSFSFTHYSVDIIKIISIFIWIRILPILLSILDIRPKIFQKEIQSVIWSRMLFGISFIPKDLFLWLGHSADRFLISYMMGPASVGIYASIYKIASIVKFVSQPVTFTAFPELAKAWDSCNYNQFNIQKWKTAGLYLLFSLPVFLLFLFAPIHMLACLSKELMNTRGLLIWISLGLMIHTIQVLTGYYIYVFSNKVLKYTIMLSAINVMGLLGQYFLLLEWRLIGAAFGSFLIYFILWMVVVIDSANLNKNHFFPKGVVRNEL